MNDPPRLLDPKSGSPVSRSVLRAGVDMAPPPGAKEQVWSSLSSAIGVAGVATAVSSLGPSAVSAPTQPLAASTPGATSVGGVGKASGLKLVAGKWILLSSLSLLIAGGAAYKALAGHDTGAVAQTTTPEVPREQGARSPSSVAEANPPAPSPDTGNAAPSALANDVSARAEKPPSSDHHPGASPGEHPPADGPAHLAVAPKEAPEATAETPTSPGADASASGSNALLEESAALADARAKLRANDASGALKALSDMDKRFGGGALSQERAALLIQALAQSGQRDAAARYADAFLASYPSSPLSARVRPFATP